MVITFMLRCSPISAKNSVIDSMMYSTACTKILAGETFLNNWYKSINTINNTVLNNDVRSVWDSSKAPKGIKCGNKLIASMKKYENN